jgi:hypothetical protein
LPNEAVSLCLSPANNTYLQTRSATSNKPSTTPSTQNQPPTSYQKSAVRIINFTMEHTTHIGACEPFPSIASILDSAPTTPQHDNDAPILAMSTPIIELRTPSFPTAPESFSPNYEGPLYTEINIPLPSIPIPPPSSSTTSSSAPRPSLESKSESRERSRTLSSLSPFRHRRSSSISSFPCPPSISSHAYSASASSSKDSEEWPRIRKDVVKSREVNAAMNLQHPTKRSRGGSIDALAVVPAVLVLSAELFTPGETSEGRRKDSGVGRWEDGLR